MTDLILHPVPDEEPPVYAAEIAAEQVAWDARRAPVVALLTAAGYAESVYCGPVVTTPSSPPWRGPLYTVGWMLDEPTTHPGRLSLWHWGPATRPYAAATPTQQADTAIRLSFYQRVLTAAGWDSIVCLWENDGEPYLVLTPPEGSR
jgi:hypothetical protein